MRIPGEVGCLNSGNIEFRGHNTSFSSKNRAFLLEGNVELPGTGHLQRRKYS